MEAEGMEISQTHQCYVLMMLGFGKSESSKDLPVIYLTDLIGISIKGLLEICVSVSGGESLGGFFFQK